MSSTENTHMNIDNTGTDSPGMSSIDQEHQSE